MGLISRVSSRTYRTVTKSAQNGSRQKFCQDDQVAGARGTRQEANSLRQAGRRPRSVQDCREEAGRRHPTRARQKGPPIRCRVRRRGRRSGRPEEGRQGQRQLLRARENLKQKYMLIKLARPKAQIE